jgi:hypothetical protein
MLPISILSLTIMTHFFRIPELYLHFRPEALGHGIVSSVTNIFEVDSQAAIIEGTGEPPGGWLPAGVHS